MAEGLLVLDADVLAHLHIGDSVILLVLRQIPHVHHIDVHLPLHSHLFRLHLNEGCLFLAESDTGRTRPEMLGRVHDQRAPTAPHVQLLHTLLHLGHLAYFVQLSFLSLLQVFILAVEEYAAALEASAVKEPALEVIAPIVDVRDILLVASLEELTDEVKKEIFDDALGEAHGEQVLAVQEHCLDVVIGEVQLFVLEGFDGSVDWDLFQLAHLVFHGCTLGDEHGCQLFVHWLEVAQLRMPLPQQ